jgi:hypothetical protein
MLYTCLIEEAHPKRPFVQVYWAYGEHLGAALERMRRAALANGLKRPRWKQADPFEPADLKSGLFRSDGGEILWSDERFYFESEPGFTPPYGVIASCIEGPFDIDDIRVGYHLSCEDGLYTLEANTTEERLLEDYIGLLRAHEPFRVFWVKVHGHWSDAVEDELYANESITTASTVETLLATDPPNGLRNGFVTLTAFLNEGATNFNISDHKKIVVLTRSEAIAEQVENWLGSRKYPRLDPFVTMDDRMHHWHYRDPQGLDRLELVERLQANGFSRWRPPGTRAAG